MWTGLNYVSVIRTYLIVAFRLTRTMYTKRYKCLLHLYINGRNRILHWQGKFYWTNFHVKFILLVVEGWTGLTLKFFKLFSIAHVLHTQLGAPYSWLHKSDSAQKGCLLYAGNIWKGIEIYYFANWYGIYFIPTNGRDITVHKSQNRNKVLLLTYHTSK